MSARLGGVTRGARARRGHALSAAVGIARLEAVFPALLPLLAALASPSAALAQARVVVGEFEGPSAARARAGVMAALSRSRRFEVVANERAEGAAQALHAELTTQAGRAAVANELAIHSFMDGQVQRRGKLLELTLTVYRGKDGTLVGQSVIRARPSSLQRTIYHRVLGQLERAKPNPSRDPDPEPDDEPQTRAEREDRSERHVEEQAPPADQPAPPQPEPAAGAADTSEQREPPSIALEGEVPDAARHAFELDLGPAALARSYTYTDPRAPLPEQAMAPAAAARLHLRWYPGAQLGDGVVSNVALDAALLLSATQDARQSGSVFPTQIRSYTFGLHLRLPIGEHELGALAGYDRREFRIGNSQAGERPVLPSVTYDGVRLGSDGRIRLARRLVLRIGAAYLWLQNLSGIVDRAWFPHATGGGFDAELGLELGLAGPLVLMVSADFTRYFLTFHPQPMDPGVLVQRRIAGGGVDQYLCGVVALAVDF